MRIHVTRVLPEGILANFVQRSSLGGRIYSQFLIYVTVIYGYILCRLLSPSSPSFRCLVPLDTVVFGISVFRYFGEKTFLPPSPSLFSMKGKGGAGEEWGARAPERAHLVPHLVPQQIMLASKCAYYTVV